MPFTYRQQSVIQSLKLVADVQLCSGQTSIVAIFEVCTWFALLSFLHPFIFFDEIFEVPIFSKVTQVTIVLLLGSEATLESSTYKVNTWWSRQATNTGIPLRHIESRKTCLIKKLESNLCSFNLGGNV